jgi:hypothetical protein
MKEIWRQLEPGTAQLIVGDARITITCAAGGPSPEAWWAGEHLADRLEVLERLAGRREGTTTDLKYYPAAKVPAYR